MTAFESDWDYRRGAVWIASRLQLEAHINLTPDALAMLALFLRRGYRLHRRRYFNDFSQNASLMRLTDELTSRMMAKLVESDVSPEATYDTEMLWKVLRGICPFFPFC